VSVTWSWSPLAVSVAVADSSVSKNILLADSTPWNTPILATVTGSESVPFAVQVLVSVVVVPAAVCA
jgi:hypothetical protein